MMQFLELLAIAIISILLYQVFISEKIEAYKERRAQSTSADKIARLKLLSDDPKEIEKFIVANAADLSNVSMNQLLARLETLHADRVINDDSRFRVSNTAQTVPVEYIDAPAGGKTKRN